VKKKRGPMSPRTVKHALKEMNKERNTYRGQLRRRESDFEQKTAQAHTEEIIMLTNSLEEANEAARKARESTSRNHASSTARVDELLNKIASEGIAAEGALLEAKNTAKKEFNYAIAAKERMIASRDEKLAQALCDVTKLEEMLETQVEVSTERLATIRSICGRLGGAPNQQRTESELEEFTDHDKLIHRGRMTAAIASVIGVVGESSEISVVALVAALDGCGYLEMVFDSKEVWDLRMDWVDGLRDDLSLSWTAQLTSDIRDRLVCSYDKIDELRYSLSHHRVGKQLRPRTWFINPWNGRRLNFPQPIRPRSGPSGWAHLVREMQVRHGLTMDSRGRVAQRSYAATVALQYHRDEARGLLRPVTEITPLTNVIGADGTGVGKRSIMHVASSVAPSYRDGISVENEKKY
jgi:hypothetical protein